MTAKTKTTKTTKAPLTYPVAVSRDDANRDFKRRMGHLDNDSSDSDITRFLRTMDAIYAVKGDGFTVTDVCRFSERWAIDTRKVLELWTDYLASMKASKKLVEVSTCLDEKMYAAVR
ncbi:MAG TPA: hypothetical protein VHG71_11530 [Verrucomicrobiae bacterium]|nr:hypothetical protein [Verrucomicrobiae bacterium]